MKPSRFFLLLLICSSVAFVSAQVVLTNNVRVYSENDVFYANIAKTTVNITELSIHDSKSSDELWSSWLEWGRDHVGYLSNDGAVFIAVNGEYSGDHSLITVYRQGKQESYSVKAIPVNKEHLKILNGKYLWIDVQEPRARFLYDASGAAASFELELIDKRLIGIELK